MLEYLNPTLAASQSDASVAQARARADALIDVAPLQPVFSFLEVIGSRYLSDVLRRYQRPSRL